MKISANSTLCQVNKDVAHIWNPVGFHPRDCLSAELHRYSDHARYFLHRIHCGRVFGQAKEDWVRLKAASLRPFFTERDAYKRVRDRLIDRAVIVCDGRYIVGEKSYGYRLGPEFFGMRQHMITIKDQKLANKILARREDWIKAPEPVHRHLLGNLRRVAIDYPAALGWLLGHDNFEPRDETSLQMLRDGQFYFHVCDYGRVHTNLTSLRSDLRGFLTYQGQPLVNLDIRNSQPLFFAVLLKHQYASRAMPADVERYIALCAQGRFYDVLMAEAGVPKEARGAFKRTFFAHVFFCENRYETDDAQAFGALYPNVYAAIRDHKAEDYTELAKSLQRAESALMIGKVAARCMRDRPHAFIATIHDSILTTPGHADAIQQMMREEFGAIGLEPTIRTEPLRPPEMPNVGATLHRRERPRQRRKQPPEIQLVQ